MNLLPAFVGSPEPDQIYHLDIFTLCAALPDNSVDMILCDLPYQVHDMEWDNIIPIEPMWEAFRRVIKPRGAIVLTGVQPFSAKLIVSNLAWFKYEWVWKKTMPTNFLNARNRPLRLHENILIFSEGTTANCSPNLMAYYPQTAKRDKPIRKRLTSDPRGQTWGGKNRKPFNIGEIRIYEDEYPRSVIEFESGNYQSKHPNQKPVALFEYLIKTYTQPGELVFDPCVGSGTTALAAYKTGRHFICGDITREYVDIARERLDRARLDKPHYVTPDIKQHTLFEAAWG